MLPPRPSLPRGLRRRRTSYCHLGNIWSINNVVWNKDVPPLAVAKGERVELVFVNQTPMLHPMHLHGHEFEVVDIDGYRFSGAVRDTILVPPNRRVTAARGIVWRTARLCAILAAARK